MRPSDPGTPPDLGALLLDMERPAESMCRAYLARDDRTPSGSLSVGLALGKVLLEAGKNTEAIHEFKRYD